MSEEEIPAEPQGEEEVVDFGTSPVSYTSSKVRIYVSIDSIVKDQLSPDGLQALLAALESYANVVLRDARKLTTHEASAANAQMTPADIHGAISLQMIRKPEKTPKEQRRDLGIGVALAALGASAGVVAHAGEVSHAHDMAVIIVFLLVAVALFYFGD